MTRVRSRLTWTALALVSSSLPLRAQSVLGVEHKGKIAVVRAIDGSHPLVEENGKLVPASGRGLTLKRVDEYAPVIVSVHELSVRTMQLQDREGGTVSRTFTFQGEFVSPYKLENVFVVLELDTTKAGQTIFVREVGALSPQKPKSLSLDFSRRDALGEGKYQVHVFVYGREVFQSMMPPDYIERTLDEMVARRISGIENAAPKPFVAPPPAYPLALRGSKLTGTALVGFVIASNGRVRAPEVASATNPAFGEAALATIRQWRFLPKVQHGHAVETKAEMPFDFIPDEANQKP